MGGPQKRRGRDPELHEIHIDIAAANEYTGQHGELTFVADEDGNIIQLRAHNGQKKGGFAVPMAPGNVMVAAAMRVVLPPVEITVPAGGSMTVRHALGYFPDVQMISSLGEIMSFGDLSVTHDDVENVTFANAGATDLTLLVIFG